MPGFLFLKKLFEKKFIKLKEINLRIIKMIKK